MVGIVDEYAPFVEKNGLGLLERYAVLPAI